MTFTPTILSTVNAVVDNKFQNLSTLVNQELQNSTYLRHLQKSNQSFINHTIDNSPTISNLLRSVQDLQSSHRPSTISTRPSGFHQPESKDFHVSCLLKLLDTVNLASDSLQDLETFHDTIQSHFSTVSTSSDIFPKYKNLTPTFKFQDHLCCPKLNPHLKPSDLNQSLLNYDTFGSGLRQFILNPKTIPQNTAPDSYLQLLSLRHESDGFLLYQNFIFLCSPQLEGKFINYRAEINKLSIVNGESIRSFYSRVIWLYNELQLARIQDGSLAVLLEHFLTLLRSTRDHVILAETSNTWKQIKTHRRMPNYMTQPLPWTLNQVLHDLEIANVTNLYLPNHYHPVSPSSTDNIPDSMALKVMHSRPKHRPNIPSPSHYQNLPHSATFNKNNKCLLCDNQHPNPWHATEQCPFKDQSLIQNKHIRDNAMQHNTLYGRTNSKPSHNKPQTINNNLQHYTKQPHQKLAKLADLQLPTLDSDITPSAPPPPSTSDDTQENIYHHIPETTPDTSHQDQDYGHQLIDTQFFDVLTPTANASFTPVSTNTIPEPIDTSDIIFDLLHYLHYSS
jgi:hypothetical protein